MKKENDDNEGEDDDKDENNEDLQAQKADSEELDDSDSDSLITKVKKYLAENGQSGRRPQPQPDPTVADPLHTRCPGGDHPLPNASNALPNASANANTRESKLAQQRAEYHAQLLRESTAAKSPIDDLPPERQQSLCQLIEDGTPLTVIVEMIGAPEPLGWGFKTSHASLRRFKERCRKKAIAAERANIRAEADETIQQTGANEQTYMDAARRLLKIRLYKNAANPKGSDAELELIMRLLDRQRRTDLAERRVRVTEQRVAQQIEK